MSKPTQFVSLELEDVYCWLLGLTFTQAVQKIERRKDNGWYFEFDEVRNCIEARSGSTFESVEFDYDAEGQLYNVTKFVGLPQYV